MKPPNVKPPRWAKRLLTWLHPAETLEEVEGDLDELFTYWYQRGPTGRAGQTQATLRYLLNVVSVLPPLVRRRQRKQEQHPQPYLMSPAMIRSYLNIAWRNLRKQPGFTFINVFGLSAGLTCFALIALWVNDELSYDQFNQHYDRVVRVVGEQKTETGVSESAVTSAPMAKALKNDYAEVENAVRLKMREELVQYQNKQWRQPTILLTDPSFFDVFSYQLIRGNPATALNEPYSVILTESTAKKYFGDADPIGQVLTIYMFDSTSRGANYQVTGLTPDPPKNAHFTFSMLVSFKTIEVARPDVLTVDGWGDHSFYTYLLLKKGVDPEAFSKKIARFYAPYIGDLFKVWRSIYVYKLQPLRDVHLRSHLEHEMTPTGSLNQVYVFSTIGLFILLLAGVNYTNLATARSAGRAKEVGVKKVMGAGKAQLIGQYLAESVFVALLALLLSCLLSLLIQPFLYFLTGKALSLFSSPQLLLFLTGVALVLGILAGLYPAFALSSFEPVTVLKGAFRAGAKGIALRQSLIVSQFVITIILITSIVIMYAQMRFVGQKDLGYDKDALLYIQLNGNADVIQGYDAFRNDLLGSPLIRGITTSNSLLVSGLETGVSQTVDRHGKPIQVSTSRLQVDTNYVSVHGIRLVAGKNFTRQTTGNGIREIILNESAVKKFGWKSAGDAIGKPFTMGDQQGIVVGVVRDFHFNSLQHRIEPLAIYPQEGYFSRITVKIDLRQAGPCIALLENVWKRHFPNALFDYDFLDRRLAEQYQNEARFSSVILFFSVLSLLIACLGLYGLVAYSTAQRTKEIGIRKTLGASVTGIVVMLSNDFLKLVLLASFIALPVTWYVMQQWLQNFAYQITPAWWMFAASVLLVLLVALLTVSFQSIKAALVNPVKSLRNE